MKLLLLPALALASTMLAGCPGNATDDTSSKAAETAPAPEIEPGLEKYNVNLPKKGDALPDIAGMTLQGKAIDNEWLKGKTTLINLWFYN
ncbi:MAG: hypothetical protein ACI9EF_000744 [Pseudohongiellaceae bacterium]|jgi:hypothetical protein